MNESTRQPSGRLPLVPFLELLVKARGSILGLAFGAAVLAAAFGLIAPVTYESHLTILPPQQSSPFGMSGGGLEGSLAMLQYGLSTLRSADLYADMIKSRSVYRYAIDRLGLLSAFGLAKLDTLRGYEFAFNQLREDVTVETANNGLITVTTRAHTRFFPGAEDKLAARRRAADLGNVLAQGLDVVNREKNTSQARQARIYLEEQVDSTNARLSAAGTALADFQTQHLAVDLDEQMKVGIENAGKLQADVMAREVALGVALRSMQPGNPEVQRLTSEVEELRRQLRRVQTGATTDGDVALEKLPDLARQYALLIREVKVQEALYEMLTAQLYQARVKETEQVSVVQVLDEACMPVTKKAPVIRKVVLMAFALGLAFGVFLAYVREWWRQYPYGQEDARALRALLRR
ncbi:MAG: GNVR domain-containing protein [Candidatus Eisenbacteria bacterium]